MDTEICTAKGVLRHTVLTVDDAARLIVEGVEGLGGMVGGMGRDELVKLMRRVVQEGVAAVQGAEQTVSLEKAAWESVAARGELRASSRRDLRHFVRRILRVEGVAGLPLRRMTPRQCREILQAAFGRSKSSYVKGRAILHSIFAYGVRREWCDANPVSRIEVPRVVERRIEPLSVSEVNRLLAVAQRPEHRDMLVSAALLLYGGVRPAEVARLRPEDFHWEEGHIVIPPQSSKTGGGRVVPLPGMLMASADGATPIPRNWQRRWKALRSAAGFSDWVPDVCRHTFASYHVAYFRNLAELQLVMGHRDAMLLRSRYIVPASARAAALFWRGAGVACRA